MIGVLSYGQIVLTQTVNSTKIWSSWMRQKAETVSSWTLNSSKHIHSKHHLFVLIIQSLKVCEKIKTSISFVDQRSMMSLWIRIIFCFTGVDVSSGGDVYMNMLSSEGWSPSYHVEAIILQVAETLVQGGARIRFGYQYE